MKSLFLVLLFQFSTLCSFSQWTNLGLDDYQVNDLTIYADTIYASTNDGIYKKSIYNTNTEWSDAGKQGAYIVQTLVENHSAFYAVEQNTETNTTQLFKSENGGNTFSLMSAGISNTNAYSYQFLDHIAHPPNNYDTLYTLYHQLKTNDGGTSWQSIHNSINTDRFIMVNPTNHAQLIIGGEGDLFNATLQISNDWGETWDFPAMNSFFAGDNAIHDLAVDENIWYAAGEGVIKKSENGGENWTELLNLFEANSIFSLYYSNIEFSPVNKNILYVSGYTQVTGNEVPLLYSDNQGGIWDTIYHNGIPDNQRIRCLTVENVENTDYVFLGGKGVYVYKRVVTNVENAKNELNVKVYPNPTTDVLYINYNSKENGRISVNVFDIQGRLLSQQQMYPDPSEQRFSIDTSSLNKGTYVLQLVQGKKTGYQEFVVK